MEILEVDPGKVWGFYPYAGLRMGLIDAIKEHPETIPRVPIFRIPQDIAQGGEEFMLADGAHRKNVYLYLDKKMPVILYSPGERIDIQRDNLAPARGLANPNLFEGLVKRYLFIKANGYI